MTHVTRDIAVSTSRDVSMNLPTVIRKLFGLWESSDSLCELVKIKGPAGKFALIAVAGIEPVRG